MSSDTDWEMPVGGHFTAYYALVMREHMRRYGTTEEQMALVSVKNHGNARFHPLAQKPMDINIEDVMNSSLVASPFKLLDCSLLSDGAAAVILATEEWAKKNVDLSKHPHVYLTGSGSATDYARAGERPREVFTQFSAKKLAAQQAYAMAGLSNPLKEIDVAEVYDSYTGAELLAYEALGFCELGQSGKMAEQEVFNLDGDLAVNPSGGLLGFGAAAGATGIAQAIEVITQLRGEASKERQVKGARIGLTDTHAGVCTVAAVHIFESRS
jgi:acetyl-CoA C-acetyltransferase